MPDLILTEDSNSGKQMMELLVTCSVKSGFGKDKIASKLDEILPNYNFIYIIVDGAAFGNCIGLLASKIIESERQVVIFAPESFEYLLLNIGRFKSLAGDRLVNTQDYADISEYLTWEKYYTSLLEELCMVVHKKTYNKSKLASFLRTEKYIEGVKQQLSDLNPCIFKEIN